MAKTITVIDTKHWISYDCSKTEAARIIGVDRMTITEWSKKRSHETFNYFVIVFNHVTIKQPKKSNLKIKKSCVSMLEMIDS